MVALRFDARVVEYLDRAPSDPDAAAQLLLIAAEYLRSDKPLPFALMVYLAQAFEDSMTKCTRSRGVNKAVIANENARLRGHALLLERT
jgi:hypothetical protein